ncbi:MAG: hypothetical protein KGI59_01175 [Patescibacteria group bacterium]|nr:hypothetical protein [Patescibacteria group bacterium]MDE2172693.1 hypothetical protein [Patescibacteria group bacterium]
MYLTFPGTLEQKLKRVIGFRLAQEDGQLYMVADYLNPNRFRRTVKLGLIGGRGKIFTQVCDEIDFLNAALEDIFAEHRHMEEQEKQILMFA